MKTIEVVAAVIKEEDKIFITSFVRFLLES